MCFHLSLSNYLPLLKEMAVTTQALKSTHLLETLDFNINDTRVDVLNAASNNRLIISVIS